MAANTFRRRPVVVTALRWDGTAERAKELHTWGSFDTPDQPGGYDDDPDATASLLTSKHSRWELLYTGDWVICDADGALSCMSDDEFRTAYEPATTDNL